jgi:hypothetical protein
MTSGINHTNWFFHGAIADIDEVLGKGYRWVHASRGDCARRRVDQRSAEGRSGCT